MLGNKVSREIIAPQVIEKLVGVAEPRLPIEETTELEGDLGMTRTFRQALALPFSRITARYGGRPVSISAAAQLKTVGDAINLVHKNANA